MKHLLSAIAGGIVGSLVTVLVLGQEAPAAVRASDLERLVVRLERAVVARPAPGSASAVPDPPRPVAAQAEERAAKPVALPRAAELPDLHAAAVAPMRPQPLEELDPEAIQERFFFVRLADVFRDIGRPSTASGSGGEIRLQYHVVRRDGRKATVTMVVSQGYVVQVHVRIR